jgi:2',3'-cyclic-nucleotide 2'-phosphodiesterase (5'-nucleotidase family)
VTSENRTFEQAETQDISLSDNVPAIGLNMIGTFAGEDSEAEIVAYDPDSQRLFISKGKSELDILDASDPTNPSLFKSVSLGSGESTSVAISGGVVAVAVPNENVAEAGSVLFFDTDGNQTGEVTVGALPDMVTFTPDGNTVLVANEGEPNDDYTIDPEGSVSIIDISGGVASATVATAGFSDFNAGGPRAAQLPDDVRIFGNNGQSTVAQDLEPEYIAATNSTAWVTLQENNALAVVDIANARVDQIVALGFKQHGSMTTFGFEELPLLGTTEAGEDILLGGLSGLFFEGVNDNGNYQFVTHPDRGPNPDTKDVDDDGVKERPFALPDYQARVIRFELNPQTGALNILEQIFLTRADGTTPISGLPNLPGDKGMAYADEEPVDLRGNPLEYDPFGADMEGIVIAPNGDFWMVDEYRPAIYHFTSDGTLVDRFVPEGSNDSGTNVGTEALPAVYAQRRANRGFEAVALQGNKLYAFIQSPIDVPDTDDDSNSKSSHNTRILEFDITTSQTTAQYVYVQEGNGSDKIGDAVSLGNNEFLVMERDSATGQSANKKVYKISLDGATDISSLDDSIIGPEGSLESMDLAELEDANISPVSKEVYVDLVKAGYDFTDKPEGLAYIPDEDVIAVINDNDFNSGADFDPATGTLSPVENPIPVVLGWIDPDNVGNGFDASNKDGAIQIREWPRVKGMYQPDAIAAFSAGGDTYLITANEGDARDYDGYSEETRVEDLTLDPTNFPHADIIQAEEELGRLKTTTANGDTDGDGDVDEIYAYGARSFSIWSSDGNLVYDSGEEIERITAAMYPEYFNQDEFEFDGRSDDKGPEPEGVVTGVVDGTPYAFVGLERMGGIMVYDISTPDKPVYVQYINTTNMEAQSGNISPEGLTFIAASDSPTNNPLLVVAYEESGTVAFFEITGSQDAGTLTLLHNNDGESSLQPGINGIEPDAGFPNTRHINLPVGGVATFKSVMEREIADARASGNSVLSLYAGDAFLASAVVICSQNDGKVYDAIAQRQMPYDAHVIGNHEFDYEPSYLRDFINSFKVNGFLSQPFLSANLDFSNEYGFNELTSDSAIMLDPVQHGEVIGKAAILTDNMTGQTFGIVAMTTPMLPSISSPENVVVQQDIATIAQQQINTLQNEYGIRKIIFVSHLQSLENDRDLIKQLRGVDIAVAGGGDEMLANSAIELTEQLLPGEAEEVVDEYPLVEQDASGRDVYIITAKGNYNYLGRLDARFDANGEVAEIISETSYPRRVVPATNEARILQLNDAIEPDANIVSSVYEPLDACVESYPEIARSEVVLDVAKSSVRSGETNIGNLIADSFMYAYNQLAAAHGLPPASQSNPVIAVQNGGGIRQNAGDVLPQGGIAPGVITGLDTANVLPFPNDVTVIQDVSPSVLKQVFERSAYLLPGSGGQFLQVSGLKVVYDTSGTAQVIEGEDENATITTPGSRVWELTLDDGTQIVSEGEVVEGAPNVSIVTNSFTAGGGDNYLMFADMENKTNLEQDGETISYEEAWVMYLQSLPREAGLPTVSDDMPAYQPGGEGRITLRADDSDGDGGNRDIDVVSTVFMPMVSIPAAPVSVRILHTNDTHAHLESEEEELGGISRRKTLVDQMRSESADAGESVLLLDAGDVFQGTLFFNQYEGLADAWFYNELQYDAMAIGNHEFDKGPSVLATFIDEVNFPVISANADVSNSPDLAGNVAPWVVIERDGEKFGILGLTTDETEILSSPGPVTFSDPIAAAQQAVTELEAQGIDKIIALTHLGYTHDLEVAQQVGGIDIIVGGHSHTKMGSHPDATNPYPVVMTGPDGKTTLVITNWEWGKYLGNLHVVFDPMGNVLSWSGEPIAVDDTVEMDETFEAKVAEFAEPLETLKQTVIGQAAVDLNGERDDVRSKETNLGNLIADVLLEVMKNDGAQVAIQNGGGIRASIPAGEVTMGQVLEVLPFGNTIAAVTLTGEQVQAALENGVSQAEEGAGRFPQVAGMRYTWDPTAEPGSRIVSVEIADGEGSYEPIDPSATYRLATNNYMLGGGDGYSMFAEGADKLDSGLLMADELKEYISENSPVSPEVEGRITSVESEAAVQMVMPLRWPLIMAKSMAMAGDN